MEKKTPLTVGCNCCCCHKMASIFVEILSLLAWTGRKAVLEYMLLFERGCGQFIDDSGLLSLMVLVLIYRGILVNCRGRMNNEIPIEHL